ncbi:MAG: hypothetical protein C9356_16590 [Oleiphilus sp.]|nr:MAG: hypothetical protein C9356_16590 [Oleiphilus sp.]
MDKELGKYFDIDERREEVRMNIGAEIFIECVAAEPGEGRSAEVLRCEAVDVSANGMQVMVERKLVQGAIHTLVVEVYRNEDVYRLTSEVKWVEKKEDGYLIGLALFDSEDTEIIDWKLAMAKLLN